MPRGGSFIPSCRGRIHRTGDRLRSSPNRGALTRTFPVKQRCGIGLLMGHLGASLRRGFRFWRRSPKQKATSLRTVSLGSAAVPHGVRVYAIGDIHGRADLLDKLHARIDIHRMQAAECYEIEVYLGDYIDRGHQSREVIDRLIRRSLTRNVITLSGNHEGILLDVLNQPALFESWARTGGLETLMSYGIAVPNRANLSDASTIVDSFREALPSDHLRFFRTLGDTFECGDFLFVHAGVRPNIPLSEQAREDLLWIRDVFLNSKTNYGYVIVHGHTPNRSVQFLPNRINIDTGAYITGVLSCLVIEGHEASIL